VRPHREMFIPVKSRVPKVPRALKQVKQGRKSIEPNIAAGVRCVARITDCVSITVSHRVLWAVLSALLMACDLTGKPRASVMRRVHRVFGTHQLLTAAFSADSREGVLGRPMIASR
jgi:hypothetical protein